MNRSRGFTLIELMVVVVIIALLTALILPSIFGSKPKARDAQRVSDLGQLQLALELEFDRCGQYPQYPLAVADGNGCPSGITLGTFIAQIPTDPSTKAPYDYMILESNHGAVSYILHAKLESVGNPAIAKGLDHSSITLPADDSWEANNNFDPSVCSNSSTSVDYCVSPN